MNIALPKNESFFYENFVSSYKIARLASISKWISFFLTVFLPARPGGGKKSGFFGRRVLNYMPEPKKDPGGVRRRKDDMLTDQMTDADKNGAGSGSRGEGALRPARVFGNGMILQRGRPVPVWGTARPRVKIFCRAGAAEAVTYAGDDGHFFLKLPPLPAADKIEVSLSDGKDTVVFRDVAVGEVFLVSGQSNMEYDLVRVKEPLPVPPHPVRCFRPRPSAFPGWARDVEGNWVDFSERTGVSAVGFFFAADIAEKWDVPVGLLSVSRGGVGAETFVSECRLAEDPFYGKELEKYESLLYSPAGNPEPSGDAVLQSQRLARRIESFDPSWEMPASLLGWERPEYDDSAWQVQNLPDSWAAAGHPHAGVFLYRKRVALPPRFRGRELVISPGICDRADRCFVNGRLIGSTGKANLMDHWNTVRRYTLPAELNRGGELTIAIEVAACCSICTFGGMTGPEKEMFIACGEEKISLAGDWRIAEAADFGCAAMEDMVFTGTGEAKSFHMLCDNLLRPLAPYGVSGVLWYQGEANTETHPERYGALLKGVIRTFRDLWQSPRLPFITFLLPGFQRPHLYTASSTWATVRACQLAASLEETGYPPVNICDCGDVDEIHPPEKRIPGLRASAFYRALAAGQTPPSGAVFTGYRVSGKNKITLKFDTWGSALVRTSPSVAIAGVKKDGSVAALAGKAVSPDEVEILLPDGEEIVTVACGWCENPENTGLVSENGLPAFPFKFDLKNNPEKIS